MEKTEKTPVFVAKSLVFADINAKLWEIAELIDFACFSTLKELKVYFYCGNAGKSQGNLGKYEFYEFLLGFLYHRAFMEKGQDFLFKTSIFFPFLFDFHENPEELLRILLTKEKFDVISFEIYWFFKQIQRVFLAEDGEIGVSSMNPHENTEKFVSFRAKTCENPPDFPESFENPHKYQLFSEKTLAIGGTFDYLHSGHKLFLSCAALLSTKSHSSLTIGLTSAELLEKKQGKALIQAFSLRKRQISEFLHEFHPHLAMVFVELHEPCGPAKSEAFDGLVVTRETAAGAEFVNGIRANGGLPPLKVFVTGLVSAQSQEVKLSSGDIRKEFIGKCPEIADEQLNFVEFLRSSWENELKSAGIAGNFELWFQRLFGNYLEKWRFYHTVKHIWEMLRLFQEFKGQINEKLRVFLAIWFHDAVYLPGDRENEEHSAALFQAFFEEIIEKTENPEKKAYFLKEKACVSAYILITKDHFQALEGKFKEDGDLQLFLDFDLAILGAPAERYDEYVEGVYKEYARAYDLPTIYRKRAEFLREILEKKRIFLTKPLKNRLETQALANLQRELSQISQETARK